MLPYVLFNRAPEVGMAFVNPCVQDRNLDGERLIEAFSCLCFEPTNLPEVPHHSSRLHSSPPPSDEVAAWHSRGKFDRGVGSQ